MIALDTKTRQALEKLARNNAGLAVIKAKQKRVKPSMPWLKNLMTWQRDVIEDPSRTKALLCGRRTGKTYLIIYYLLYKSLIKPDSNCFYIALSLDQAKRLIWTTLKDIIEDYNIPAKINNTDFRVNFSNGSKIILKGCGDRREADRFRGDKYDLIAIDEVSLFGPHIKYLIEEVLGPALEDYAGDLILASTPNALCSGYFYDKTTTNSEYKLTYKTVLNNSKYPLWAGKRNWKTLAKQWLEGYKIKKGWKDDNPILQREWLARWIRDDSSLVLPFSDKNIYTELPELEWEYSIGIDLGFVDEFAISVLASHKYDKSIYIVDSFKQSGLVTHKKIDIMKRYISKYNPDIIVADPGGGGAQYIADFNDATGVYIDAAQKVKRFEYVDLFADAFRTEKIKINSELTTEIEELKLLQWKDKAKCDISGADHFFDATLYIWRELLSRRIKDKPVKHIETPDELENRIEQYLIEKIRDEAEEENFYF